MDSNKRLSISFKKIVIFACRQDPPQTEMPFSNTHKTNPPAAPSHITGIQTLVSAPTGVQSGSSSLSTFLKQTLSILSLRSFLNHS